MNIQFKRENLSTKTKATYTSCLTNLVLRLPHKLRSILDSDFVEHEAVVEFLCNSPNYSKLQTRSTVLAALYACTGETCYHKCMMENARMVMKHSKEQKTLEHRIGLLSHAAIRLVHEKYMDEILSSDGFKARLWNDALLSGLASGYYSDVPPRRLDYADIKLTSYVKGEDNYYDNGSIYYNCYKTSKLKDKSERECVVRLPPELIRLIEAISHSRGGDGGVYLFLDTKGQKFNAASLHSRLKRIFGCGCDVLRSAFLSDIVYKDVPALLDLEENAFRMGHSVNAQMHFYVKND